MLVTIRELPSLSTHYAAEGATPTSAHNTPNINSVMQSNNYFTVSLQDWRMVVKTNY